MANRIVNSADEIRSILTDPEWRVRPPGNEIPGALRGTLAGEILGAFARFTDGEHHLRRKQIVIDQINMLNLDAVPEMIRGIVRLSHPLTPRDLQYLVPGMVIAHLLGVPTGDQQTLVEQVRALVIGIRPDASQADVHAAITAMEGAVPTIVATLAPGFRDDLDTVASRISMIFQASDATAAMIGNALLALREAQGTQGITGSQIVRESISARVPVRSTSRYQGADTAVLMLEIAHQQHPHAEWTFGFGPHACPGRSLTYAIVVACVDAVISEEPFSPADVQSSGWVDLPNVWIPILSPGKGDAR